MKKAFGIMMVLATVMLAAVSCGQKNTQKKAEKEDLKKLVVYYSQTSNTRVVANEMATRLDADVQEIVPVEPYDGDFEATIERGKKELEEGVLPEIQPLTYNVADYDVIFIGYPIWFGTYAQPVATFLSQVDLSGKWVVPFCTFGSGGLETSCQNIAKVQPKAHLIEGYGVRASRLEAVPGEVDNFLKANGFTRGDYIKLGDFSEQQPVSADEKAVFEAAVGDYPMIHAKPESFGVRDIPGGVEYLFIAVDLPREEGPDMPPAGLMKVYVTVMDGETPVFTRVYRR